jgi:hypothetical protein
MTTSAIMEEINRLPLTEKLLVVEKTLKTIKYEKAQELKSAANKLYEYYKSDTELTAFTVLDPETFYEAK